MMKRYKTVMLSGVLCLSLLVGCGMSEEAKKVQTMIDQMPESYTVDIEEELSLIRTAYDALSEEEKKTIDVQHLEQLEDAQEQQIVNEINEKIDALSISTEYAGDMKKSHTALSKIMDEIEQIPESVNNDVHYDILLEKIQNLSDDYTTIIMDADTNINAIEDMYKKLNLINTATSSATSYSYACDVAEDISKLTKKWTSSATALKTKANELKDACLYGESFDISLAVLELIQEDGISETISNYYQPFLKLPAIVDDCLSWQQTINEKIEN